MRDIQKVKDFVNKTFAAIKSKEINLLSIVDVEDFPAICLNSPLSVSYNHTLEFRIQEDFEVGISLVVNTKVGMRESSYPVLRCWATLQENPLQFNFRFHFDNPVHSRDTQYYHNGAQMLISELNDDLVVREFLKEMVELFTGLTPIVRVNSILAS
jgi:hypothetical protein